MQFYSLLAVSLSCALAWAQPDTTQPVTSEPASADQLGSDTESGWSLTDLRLRDTTFYWENDGTVPNFGDDTDRYYTNGIGIELSFDPNFSDELSDRFAPGDNWNDPRFGLGLAVKQLIFTGVDITDPTPSTDDHPYAGYLYLAFSFQRADDQRHDHFELDLGVVGEQSQAEAVQRFIHKTFPDENDPQGWSSQLANELTLNFTFERTWKTQRGEIKGVEFEMLPAIGFDLGNVYTRARGKVTLRAGMNLPDDFGPATLLGHKDHTLNASNWGEGDWSFYLYTTLGVDAVAWNIFLDGNTFATSQSVDSEPLVATAMLGVVTRYKGLYLGWAQAFQTEEFESQPDEQTWGSLAFGCSFSY